MRIRMRMKRKQFMVLCLLFFLLLAVVAVVVEGIQVQPLSLTLSIIPVVQVCNAFAVVDIVSPRLDGGYRHRRHTRMNTYSRLNNNNNNYGDVDADTDKERARLLREEVRVMEDSLRVARENSCSGSSRKKISAIIPPQPVVNTQLEDSIWTLSYRFSSQPIQKDEDNNSRDNDNNQEIEEQKQKLIFYSGKMNLLLKKDGYSEQLLPPVLIDINNNSNDIEIIKVWGWDRETSGEDNLDYLLFSMDVKLPNSDPLLSSNKKNQNQSQIERFYFQARIEQLQENQDNIVLKDGTITVKKDIAERTKGRWGLFNVAGILTEFRYCGNFVAKPSSS